MVNVETMDVLKEFQTAPIPAGIKTSGRETAAGRIVEAALKLYEIQPEQALIVPLSKLAGVKNPINSVRFKAAKMKAKIRVVQRGDNLLVWVRH